MEALTADVDDDRDHRRRAARRGFGFKPPPRHGRPGPAAARPPPAALTQPGDGPTPADMDDDDGRSPVNGDVGGGHVVNGGIGDVRAPAPTRAGPPTKKDVVQQRQPAGARNRQSALRRPAPQRAAETSSRAGCPQQRRVGKATTDGAAQSPLVNGGGQQQQPSAASVRQKPDRSVRLLVNYRSTSDPHAPLQSAFGNRDFFKDPSSCDAASDATTELPHSGVLQDVRQTAPSGQSTSVFSIVVVFTARR